MSSVSNWIDRFVNEVKNLTDAPELFIRAAAYFTAGSAIRKQAYYYSNKNIYPNLYYLFVAPPAKYRKTTTLEIGQLILHSPCGLMGNAPLVSNDHFLPTDGSDVAFDEALTEARGYGIAYYEEFSKFVGSARREHTSQMNIKFLEYFTPLGMDKKARTKKGGETIVPKGTVVSFSSACTDEDFQAFMTSGAVSSGQLSRMMILKPTDADARKPFDTMPETPPHFYESMANELRGLVPKIQTKLVFSKAARSQITDLTKELDRWYSNQASSNFLKLATGRTTVILERLAMIHAVMRGSSIIESEDIDEPTNQIISPYIGTIKYLNRFGYLERPDQILRARIYSLLEGSITATEYTLAKTLNESTRSIRDNLRILVEQDHVHQVKFNGYFMYMIHDEHDEDRDTLLAKAERAEKEYRAILLEEKKKSRKEVPH